MVRDPSVTHKIMSAVKSKDTRPEIMLRKALWQEGLRYRVNYKELAGKPDIVFTKQRIALFVDGDYWHGHNWALRGYASLEEELKHYSDFWAHKIRSNVERDQIVNTILAELGWHVLRIWESEIVKDLGKCVKKIVDEYYKL